MHKKSAFSTLYFQTERFDKSGNFSLNAGRIFAIFFTTYEDAISENVASKSLAGMESVQRSPVWASIVNVKASPFSFSFPWTTSVVPFKDISTPFPWRKSVIASTSSFPMAACGMESG